MSSSVCSGWSVQLFSGSRLINADLGAAATLLSKHVGLQLVSYLTCGPEAREKRDSGFLFPGGDLQSDTAAYTSSLTTLYL